MINVIALYENGEITFEELSEKIWGYGQRLINEVGEEKFAYYVQLCSENNPEML